jgi:hypothetical protein
MPLFWDATPDALAELEYLIEKNIPLVQQTIVQHDKDLHRPDRGAHQRQIAASKVLLTIAQQVPEALDGLGVFDTENTNQYLGIGRISTGLGFPHPETDPDFLGIMLAFGTARGRRIDFIGINDPSSPTDTVEEFMGLLLATADAAGAEIPSGDISSLELGHLAAAQVKVLHSLIKHLGVARGTRIFGHIASQTSRTLISSTAYQQYWTGVVRANGSLGKFTLVPIEGVNKSRDLSPGKAYLSEDWKRRQREGDLSFRLYWIPFLSEEQTPLNKLTKEWVEAHRVQVGTVLFPKVDPETREAKLVALLASDMGANPGNWMQRRDEGAETELPATEFTAGRFLAYRRSQEGRNALPESLYKSFFVTGELSSELVTELIRRYEGALADGALSHYSVRL